MRDYKNKKQAGRSAHQRSLWASLSDTKIMICSLLFRSVALIPG